MKTKVYLVIFVVISVLAVGLNFYQWGMQGIKEDQEWVKEQEKAKPINQFDKKSEWLDIARYTLLGSDLQQEALNKVFELSNDFDSLNNFYGINLAMIESQLQSITAENKNLADFKGFVVNLREKTLKKMLQYAKASSNYSYYSQILDIARREKREDLRLWVHQRIEEEAKKFKSK